MFPRFALCLLPVAIAFILLAAGMAGWMPQERIYGQIMVGLLIVGGIACAVSVSMKVHRRSQRDPAAKWTFTVLTFFGVVIAYGGIVFGGCCGILIVGSRFA